MLVILEAVKAESYNAVAMAREYFEEIQKEQHQRELQQQKESSNRWRRLLQCKCFANFLCLYALPILPLIPMYANPIHIKIFPYQNTQYDLSFYDE